jgi:hypothetical protein
LDRVLPQVSKRDPLTSANSRACILDTTQKLGMMLEAVRCTSSAFVTPVRTGTDRFFSAAAAVDAKMISNAIPAKF